VYPRWRRAKQLYALPLYALPLVALIASPTTKLFVFEYSESGASVFPSPSNRRGDSRLLLRWIPVITPVTRGMCRISIISVTKNCVSKRVCVLCSCVVLIALSRIFGKVRALSYLSIKQDIAFSLSRIFGKVRALSYLSIKQDIAFSSFPAASLRLFGKVRALSYLSIKQDIAFSCFLCSFLP
jgi:hypothetical protein